MQGPLEDGISHRAATRPQTSCVLRKHACAASKEPVVLCKLMISGSAGSKSQSRLHLVRRPTKHTSACSLAGGRPCPDALHDSCSFWRTSQDVSDGATSTSKRPTVVATTTLILNYLEPCRCRRGGVGRDTPKDCAGPRRLLQTLRIARQANKAQPSSTHRSDCVGAELSLQTLQRRAQRRCSVVSPFTPHRWP